jgi:hypothetical protein
VEAKEKRDVKKSTPAQRVEGDLQPGHSILFATFKHPNREAMSDLLRGCGGTVLEVRLRGELDRKQLQEILDGVHVHPEIVPLDTSSSLCLSKPSDYDYLDPE